MNPETNSRKPAPPSLAGRLMAGTVAGIDAFVLGIILSKMIGGG